MKKVQWIVGVVFSMSLLLVLLITSFQLAAYGDFTFYQKEYEKYDVASALDMKMEDVMYVTREMMDYLIDDRENLEVYTVVEGRKQDFFNEQDKLHMMDVKQLFLGGLLLRKVAAAVMVVCLCILFATKAEWKKILARGYQISLGTTAVGVVFAAGALIMDFNAAFTVFHEVFFTNDLWIFDPAEDYMIRMLPEGFFYDMVLRIGGIFIVGMAVVLLISLFLSRQGRKNRKIKRTYE